MRGFVINYLKTRLENDVSVELREKYQQTGLYYLHGDHLGTSTFVTNFMGDPTQFFLNLPFGETMLEQTDGTYNNPYKFNAKELDEDIGLYYYGARYYNPRLSIWYGVDPLAEKMPSWSPYNYTFDNPIIYIDPNGKAPTDVVITGTEREKTLEQLRASVKGQLTLSMDYSTGKVKAIPVEGAKLTKASSKFLAATQDVCNRVELQSDGDYYTNKGAFYAGDAYQGSKMLDDGRMLGTNVVNPVVSENMDKEARIPNGVGVMHAALESYLGLLNSPGSPPADTDANKELGYNAAHKEASKLDPRYKDLPKNRKGQLVEKNFEEGRKVTNTQEYFIINTKTGERNSMGKFESVKKK